MEAWSAEALSHARENDQTRTVPLLRLVAAELEFEAALRASPPRKPSDPESQEQDIARRRARERVRELARARSRAEKRAQEAADWERFVISERRELERRERGQLADQLGEPLPGESASGLERLVNEDRRQAREGLVALMSSGKVTFKPLDALSPEDMPARIAANRLRETWLKERRDRWLGRGESAP